MADKNLAITALSLALLLVGCQHNYTRGTTWHLPDGTRVHFCIRDHATPGKDTIKVIEVTRPTGTPREYTFGGGHAGYEQVQLRMNEAGSVVWVVDPSAGRVGCSLDLATGRFVEEQPKGQLAAHPRGVEVASGVEVRPDP